jgi:hypothetical protein
MLFNEEDPLPIHTLSGAAFTVLRDLAKKSKVETFWLTDWIRPGKEKEFWNHINRHANFLKHADRDSDFLMEDFSEEINDMNLLMCCKFYGDISEKLTPTMQIFCEWILFMYPKLLKEEHKSTYENAIKEMAKHPRKTQLKIGGELLKKHMDTSLKIRVPQIRSYQGL